MIDDNKPAYRLRDSNDNIRASIYLTTADELAIQTRQGKETLFQDDGTVVLPGTKIEKVGYDEVDVPQTRNLTVADFEGGVLPESFKNDTANYEVQNSVTDTSSFALKANPPVNTFSKLLFDGTGVQPQAGDTISASVRLTDVDDNFALTYGVQTGQADGSAYLLVVNAGTSDFAVVKRRNGSFASGVASASVNLSNHVNEFLTVTLEWGADGTHMAVLTDSTGAELSRIEGTDAEYKSGRSGIRTQNPNVAPTIYFDSFTIRRRVGEYYSNTQNGTVKLGNDVQPSGGIETGPNELPTDTDQAILADQPVTDGLAQGTRVSYGLYLAEQRIARVQAEANGTGGIQHPRLVHEKLAVNPTRGSDPTAAELGEGNSTVYVSDGTADVTGDDGDVILAVNSGGTVKTTTLADFSAL